MQEETTAPPAVCVEHITLVKQDQVILEDISFQVEAGEFFTILGPSGAGKTSLLRVIAGLEKDALGNVLIMGRDVSRKPPRKRGLALVFQNYSLFPHLTVAGNVGFPLLMKKVPRARRKQRVARKIAEMDMGLESRTGARPDKLSMGQMQRTALGRATIRKRDILLLDEPLSEVDPGQRHLLRQRFRRLCKDNGLTIVYVTNNEEEAFALSDRVLILNMARVEQIGSPRQVYQEPATLFAAFFFGSPSINTAVARAVDGDSLLEDGVRLPGVPDGTVKYVVGVRPEQLCPVPVEQAHFQTRVELVETISPSRAILHLERPQGWTCLDKSGHPPQQGAQVALAVPREQMLFFDRESQHRLQ